MRQTLALGDINVVVVKSLHTVDARNPAPFGNHGKPVFVGIYQGIIIPGFLRWCEMDFVHP